MQRIETVSIDDVYPLEDEYGNSLARRDYALKANRDYVRRLADSFNRQTGQPDELVTLVRDGGIYRIKAGNSRVEAMRLLGTKSFPAIIDGDDTVKSCVEAAWRTDVKKTYEEAERAEIFRALTLFGDDEYVSETTGTDVERARRIRRGAAHADDVIDQMPLEWYEAVGEAEEAGDAEMVEALTAASASTWRWAQRGLLERREDAERAAALREALACAGVSVADSYAIDPGMRYVASAYGPDDVTGREWPEGSVAYVQGGGRYAFVYAPEPEADPAEERMRAERDAAGVLFAKADAARGDWLAANLAEVSPDRLIGLLPSGAEVPVYSDEVLAFLDGHEDVDIPMGPEAAIAAFCALAWREPWPAGSSAPDPDACAVFVALTDALEECGYEPPEAEQRLYQMAVDALGEE